MMVTIKDRTLLPWRRRAALRLLGIKSKQAKRIHRFEMQRNYAQIWDGDNPNDLTEIICFTYGKDARSRR